MPAARQRILDTAFRLFYARGLRAAGVDTLITESGVAKATFYKQFPAKDDLVLAHLDKVDGVWSGQLHQAAAAAGPAPRDQLVGLFDALGTACRRDWSGLRSRRATDEDDTCAPPVNARRLPRTSRNACRCGSGQHVNDEREAAG